jgi:hypothetical protein
MTLPNLICCAFRQRKCYCKDPKPVGLELADLAVGSALVDLDHLELGPLDRDRSELVDSDRSVGMVRRHHVRRRDRHRVHQGIRRHHLLSALTMH